MMRMRTWIRRLHLAAAAAAGLVLVVAGLSGSALVYRDELDAWLNPGLLRVAPPAGGGATISLEHTVTLATSAHAGDVARIELARGPHEPHLVVVSGEDPLQVYVDPYRGKVLGARRQSTSLTQQLFDMHTTLLAGHTGELVMGATGLLLVFTSFTGLWLWWPGVRRGLRGFAEAVRVRGVRNWKAANFDLHRAVGFWSALLLALSGLTGSALVFHDAFAGALDFATGSQPRLQAPRSQATSAPLAPLDSLLARGRTSIDALQPFYLILPASPGAPVTVRGRVPGELHPNGRNFAYLEPASGRLLALESSRAAPAGTRIYDTFYPLHIGRWGGTWSRVLYVLLGLTPLVLAVSGTLMWWQRTRRRTRGEAARPDRRLAA